MARSSAQRHPPHVSTPSRVAEPGEAISREELQLAARNHGLPLEALAYDVTPTSLHYLLTHYDMPVVDAATWRLRVGGQVQQALEIGLDALRSLPQRTVTVTFECAGNGRARQDPRAQSQPWLVEAVGTASWTGVPLARLLERAGLSDGRAVSSAPASTTGSSAASSRTTSAGWTWRRRAPTTSSSRTR